MNLFNDANPECQEIFHPDFENRKVRLFIYRLDTIHPVISGNKLFKLYYFLNEAVDSSHKKVITYGGAYSNHLVATAFAAKQLGLESIGIVRGEQAAEKSPTLLMCLQYGMRLIFISREEYSTVQEEQYKEMVRLRYGPGVIIPEGGFHPLGTKGASLIMDTISGATHICVPVGTATTMAGLITKANEIQQIIGFPVLKNMTDIPSRIEKLTGSDPVNKYRIIDKYHFGGYAKSSHELINFMNAFYTSYTIPLDFVYTAKMMFGVFSEIRAGYFPEGSKITCLHTGGLQGNISLQKGRLVY